MLPALFTALTGRYHGDLSESNILVAQDRSRFHLVDPGVIVSSSQQVPDFSIVAENEDRAFFTTTPGNYMLLPPFKDGVYEDASGSGEPHDLAACLGRLLGPHWLNADFRLTGSTCPLPRNPEWAGPRRRPHPSDLLALGTMFYRIVAGEELFFDRWMDLDWPAWVGQLATGPLDRTNNVAERYVRILSVLEDGYVARKIGASGMNARERAVAEALLSLTLDDADQLRGLLA
jgi:hypothetical protein